MSVSGNRVQVVIPFRGRGTDYRRLANLNAVLIWWWSLGYKPAVVSDGLVPRQAPRAKFEQGKAEHPPFNRHLAYNRAVRLHPGAEVFVFTEADMLILPRQIDAAVQMAQEHPGLVVPFTQYRYLSDLAAATVRAHTIAAANIGNLPEMAYSQPPESTMDNGTSIGAVNVVSRETLEITGGFTEETHGNWYDDRIIEEGFAFLTNPTRFVDGAAVHLYHLPGHTGDHLTDADKAATAHNRQILKRVRRAIRFGDTEYVRNIMKRRQESVQ